MKFDQLTRYNKAKGAEKDKNLKAPECLAGLFSIGPRFVMLGSEVQSCNLGILLLTYMEVS